MNQGARLVSPFHPPEQGGVIFQTSRKYVVLRGCVLIATHLGEVGRIRHSLFFENTPWKVYQSYRRKTKMAETTPRRLQNSTHTPRYNARKATTQHQHHDTLPSGKQHILYILDDKRPALPNIQPQVARRRSTKPPGRVTSQARHRRSPASTPRLPGPTYLLPCA